MTRDHTTRRSTLAFGITLLGLSVRPSALPAAQSPTTRPAAGKPKPDKGPPIDAQLVRQFVGAGHADLVAVKQMLAERPNLINAVWDWGGGDYETALGGASHMARADIAAYLVECGARLDLFAAAVLGQVGVVRAAVEAFPGIHRTPGPHGIPLLAHAKKAGQEEIVRLIEALGP